MGRTTATQATPKQGASELIGLAVTAVVLVITFGRFIAAGLPLLNALLGIAISLSAITAATRFIQLSSSTSTLALMLGLAVSIDHAPFITFRYRHELSAGLDREEAARSPRPPAGRRPGRGRDQGPGWCRRDHPAGVQPGRQYCPAAGHPPQRPAGQATVSLVHAIRDNTAALRVRTWASLGVTGTTAVNIDVSARLAARCCPT